MEPTAPEPTSASPNPASDAHQPRIAMPVMDVVPPPAAPEATPVTPITPPQSAPAAITTPRPDDDQSALQLQPVAVAPAPDESPDDLLAYEIQTVDDKNAQPVQTEQQAPPAPRNPATGPILITIVVVLILSALAVFAYLKSR